MAPAINGKLQVYVPFCTAWPTRKDGGIRGMNIKQERRQAEER